MGGELDHEGGANMNGMSALRRTGHRTTSFSFCLVRINKRSAVCNPEKDSQKLDHASAMKLDFQPPKL